ncbi:MAG: hypothetical protein ACFFE8_06650 [Candidatus Heimdallarchaeota archaeon]
MIETSLLITIGLLVIGAYFVVVFGGVLFVGFFLKLLKVSPEIGLDGGLPRAGTLVGMTERAIVLTFGLLGEYGAISFVFAAKSMARFKQLENRHFAEYYLIGTLLSFFLALIAAIITQIVFGLYLAPLIPEGTLI